MRKALEQHFEAFKSGLAFGISGISVVNEGKGEVVAAALEKLKAREEVCWPRLCFWCKMRTRELWREKWRKTGLPIKDLVLPWHPRYVAGFSFGNSFWCLPCLLSHQDVEHGWFCQVVGLK